MARTQSADYEERRRIIVARAARLFATAGYNGTSVADIAAACETSKSLIYHYYPAKEDILYAVMASHIDQLAADLEDVMAGGGNAAGRLDRLIHRFMSRYVDAADRQVVLLNELDSLPAAQRAEIVGKQRRIIAATQSLLVELDPSLAGAPARARVKTLLLFGMINWTHTWFDPAGPLSAAEVADLALEMLATPQFQPS